MCSLCSSLAEIYMRDSSGVLRAVCRNCTKHPCFSSSGQLQTLCVAMIGNLTEGYTPVGPFPDFDSADFWCRERELDSYVVTMKLPDEWDNYE